MKKNKRKQEENVGRTVKDKKEKGFSPFFLSSDFCSLTSDLCSLNSGVWHLVSGL
ncbi:MAG: hypothetical protein WCI77_05920 [Candidatus Omnitrophota bacterium]